MNKQLQIVLMGLVLLLTTVLPAMSLPDDPPQRPFPKPRTLSEVQTECIVAPDTVEAGKEYDVLFHIRDGSMVVFEIRNKRGKVLDRKREKAMVPVTFTAREPGEYSVTAYMEKFEGFRNNPGKKSFIVLPAKKQVDDQEK
jgi:hypothetical protein